MDRRKAIYQNDEDRADRRISITNIRLISVTERTCNLGLRIAVGARRRDTRIEFLNEALPLCPLGGVMGVLAGVVIPRCTRVELEQAELSGHCGIGNTPPSSKDKVRPLFVVLAHRFTAIWAAFSRLTRPFAVLFSVSPSDVRR